MATIKTRQEKPAPGINYSEIFIPDDRNLGTGKFTTVLQPNALAVKDPIASIILNVPVFQMSININPATKEIPVLLGKADNSPPLSQKVFKLPQNVELSETYVFEATFKNWEVKGLTMNGVSLQQKTQPGTVTFWVDPAKNPGAFTEGVSYTWGVFIVNGEECAVVSEGKTLCATLNRSTERETLIFSTEIDADPQSRHMIAVTWSDEEMNLYFDGQRKSTVKMTDFFN